MVNENISGCQRLGSGTGMNKQRAGDFSGSENIMYGTKMMDTCCYATVKTHRLYTTSSELSCKL